MSQSQSLLCGYGSGKFGERMNPDDPVTFPPHGAEGDGRGEGEEEIHQSEFDKDRRVFR